MALPMTITKSVKVAQVVAVNAVSPLEVMPRTLEELDMVQGIQQTKMSVERRREVIFQELDSSGLEGWSEANQVASHALLTEYHDIFSSEPRELGCTDLAKHETRVVDDKPFKEHFWGIPLTMVYKVYAYMKEMLEAGAIHPSLSPWCNTVILVHKKDGGLCFCIDFCKLNAKTKKDSYWLPRIQEAIESLVGVEYFSCLDLKAGFWQIAWTKHQSSTLLFTRIFQMQIYVFWAVQCPIHISEIKAELPRGTGLDILLNLFGWHDSLLKDIGGVHAALVCCVWLLPGTQPEAKTH